MASASGESAAVDDATDQSAAAAPLMAPVMHFLHPATGPSGPLVPFLSMTPPPASAVVLSLLHAFAVGTDARTGPSSSVEATGESAAAHKRARNGEGGEDGEEEQTLDGPVDGAKASSVKTKKAKKHSYVTRREEREQLEREVHALEERAQQLRAACAGGPASVQVVSYENARMREVVREQQLVFARVQSVVTESTNEHFVPSLHSYIHLTSDLKQRRDALMALRASKLEQARRFLAARTQHVTPGRESWEESRFRSRDGGYCGVRLDATAYSGTTVKTVLDGIMFFILNAEISLSEMNGTVTVRENDDEVTRERAGVLHHRLVTSARGLQVEKNAVMFYEHADESASASASAGDPGTEYALITSDFADRDDLHPYLPRERIRKDLTIVMKVEAHRPRLDSPGESKNDQGDVVMLTRWMLQKLHAPALAHRQVSKRDMEALQRELVDGLDGIVASIQQHVAATGGHAL